VQRDVRTSLTLLFLVSLSEIVRHANDPDAVSIVPTFTFGPMALKRTANAMDGRLLNRRGPGAVKIVRFEDRKFVDLRVTAHHGITA
jgi:hypothetical protein